MALPQEAVRPAFAEVRDAVKAGALTTLPLHRFPLERAAEAHVALENGAVGNS
jgi:NADPH2:quinone reductase